MITTILITAFVGVLFGFGAAYVHMQLKAMKDAKIPMPKPKFSIPTMTFRGSDQIEKEYEKQQRVVGHAMSAWSDVYQKTKLMCGCSLRESVEATERENMLWETLKREEKKLEDLKKEFKQVMASETQSLKGISLEQILAIPRCGGYDDDHIRKLFGNRHYVIPRTIADADIPAEDKLWALLHLMGDTKRKQLAMEACIRAGIPYMVFDQSRVASLFIAMGEARSKRLLQFRHFDELQWQLKRAVELMEENDE
jgi:hypothetical protein